jgi:hypothetical protein
VQGFEKRPGLRVGIAENRRLLKSIFIIFSISMRITSALFCLLVALRLSAFADTFKLPDNKPIVSFVLPDSWKPTETEAGLEAVSVDGEIYLALEFVDADSVDDVVDANLSYLKQQGVKVDKEPKNKGDSTINEMSISHTSYNGTDKDGPCEVSLSFLTVSPGKGLMITYWGSQNAADKHKESLDRILGSITKI